ncbi:hypothetical protein R1sor_017670 [Riccia sorocarpa]|uniref:Uncharacterized protein n=1 Tax=Riccia sorocarpa TaxID=122646 RepID=A0ABD3I7K8_9MARC
MGEKSDGKGKNKPGQSGRNLQPNGAEYYGQRVVERNRHLSSVENQDMILFMSKKMNITVENPKKSEVEIVAPEKALEYLIHGSESWSSSKGKGQVTRISKTKDEVKPNATSGINGSKGAETIQLE